MVQLEICIQAKVKEEDSWPSSPERLLSQGYGPTLFSVFALITLRDRLRYERESALLTRVSGRDSQGHRSQTTPHFTLNFPGHWSLSSALTEGLTMDSGEKYELHATTIVGTSISLLFSLTSLVAFIWFRWDSPPSCSFLWYSLKHNGKLQLDIEMNEITPCRIRNARF